MNRTEKTHTGIKFLLVTILFITLFTLLVYFISRDTPLLSPQTITDQNKETDNDIVQFRQTLINRTLWLGSILAIIIYIAIVHAYINRNREPRGYYWGQHEPEKEYPPLHNK